jgi:hypothetical protein
MASSERNKDIRDKMETIVDFKGTIKEVVYWMSEILENEKFININRRKKKKTSPISDKKYEQFNPWTNDIKNLLTKVDEDVTATFQISSAVWQSKISSLVYRMRDWQGLKLSSTLEIHIVNST